MKQFASWFTHGVAGGAKLRQQIYVAKTGKAVLEAVDAFFDARLNSTSPEEIAPEAESTEAFPEALLSCGD
jgi:hypothetical protein